MRARWLMTLILLATTFAYASETAQAVMASAEAEAASDHKTVLVVFHASWCSWCRRFDAMLADNSLKGIFQKYFAVARIDVLEAKEKADENTPGGAEVMEKAGGKTAGLPFLAVFSPGGDLIVNSMRPVTGNIGYPSKPEEVEWFMTMLQRSSPQMTAEEKATVHGWLVKHPQ